jgi:hypothetical protein
MKNLFCLISLFFILFAHQAVGQFTKGDILLGGGIGFYSLRYSADHHDEPITQLNIDLQPKTALFLGSRSAIGLIPNINLSWSISNAYTFKRHAGGMGLFFRRYFPFSDNLLAFVQPTATYLKNTDFDRELGHDRFLLSVIPGAAYKFNNRWMVELTLGGITQEWRNNDIGSDNEQNISQFSFDIQANSTLGLIYIISKKP